MLRWRHTYKTLTNSHVMEVSLLSSHLSLATSLYEPIRCI